MSASDLPAIDGTTIVLDHDSSPIGSPVSPHSASPFATVAPVPVAPLSVPAEVVARAVHELGELDLLILAANRDCIIHVSEVTALVAAKNGLEAVASDPDIDEERRNKAIQFLVDLVPELSKFAVRRHHLERNITRLYKRRGAIYDTLTNAPPCPECGTHHPPQNI